jgi:hypothetical protein
MQASRVDSWLTNVRMPWEPVSTNIIPVGSVNSWLQNPQNGVWTQVEVLYYAEGVHCLARGMNMG